MTAATSAPARASTTPTITPAVCFQPKLCSPMLIESARAEMTASAMPSAATSKPSSIRFTIFASRSERADSNHLAAALCLATEARPSEPPRQARRTQRDLAAPGARRRLAPGALLGEEPVPLASPALWGRHAAARIVDVLSTALVAERSTPGVDRGCLKIHKSASKNRRNND